jgi:hypothetical protein
MYIEHYFKVRLVNGNGQTIKSINIIPEELISFKPNEFTNVFLTKWSEDRKKKLIRFLGKNKGTFNLEMYDVTSGTCISGSDYIVVD